MNILPETFIKNNALQDRFKNFMKRFQVNRILRSINATKEKGVPVYSVFVFLLELVFTHMNMTTFLATRRNELPFGKDVVYRFLGKACIH